LGNLTFVSLFSFVHVTILVSLHQNALAFYETNEKCADLPSLN